ncbi:MAG: gamma-glutamylcyclotransferase family protein, partial [Pseudomonadota bacterium]
RFLAWRLCFEWANLKRLFGHGSDRVLYLGFGANLSSNILAERRISPLATKLFTLRDYALRFDHPSPWEHCSYASAEYAPGEKLHGMLLTLSGRDAARMDFYESVPFIKRYRRTWVEQDGVRIYYYQTNRSTPGLHPTEEYLGYIIDGLRHHPDVAESYQDWIQNHPTAEPGDLVTSYASPHQAGKSALIDQYRLISLKLFLDVLSYASLTEWLIPKPK